MELNKKNIKTLLGMAAAIVLFAWALQNTSRLGELVRYLLGLFSPFKLYYAVCGAILLLAALAVKFFGKPDGTEH